MQSDAVDSRNMDRSADHFLHFLQIGSQFVVSVQDVFGAFIQFLPFAGQAELFLATVDNQDIEMLLHCPQLLADGRLCHPV